MIAEEKNMNISFEEKKTEAINRMKMLGIFPETIKQFKQGAMLAGVILPLERTTG